MARLVMLDTNVLLSLVKFYEAFSYLADILSLRLAEAEFCIPVICVRELVNKLKDEGWNEKQIQNEISRLKAGLNYREIKKEPVDDQEGDRLFNKYKGLKAEDGWPKLHRPDQYILAITRRINPWRFYTTDNDFLEIAKLERIDARKFPTQDKILDLKFKVLFGGRKREK